VTVEDRLRATTEAVTAAMRPVRPLDLSPALAPAGRPRARLPRRWFGWLAPVAAGIAVITVAAILVAVRDLPGAGHVSGATPPGQGRASAGLPRYGVVLTAGSLSISDLSVIDTQTGKQVALVKHPANFAFTGVSGAADDRTFAVAASHYTSHFTSGGGGGVNWSPEGPAAWFLLRISPGSSQPVKLTRLPVAQLSAIINGFALSPDGRTLAVLDWRAEPAPSLGVNPATLLLYSVATGKALRTWTGGMPPNVIPAGGLFDGSGANIAGLTWLADGRTLAFIYYAENQAPAVRTLDTTRPGDDLLGGSRRVFTLPASGPDACSQALLTPDGRTVLCGTQPQLHTDCRTNTRETLEIDAYSAATGKRERVLYRYTGLCTLAGVGALSWAGPGNTVVAMVGVRTVRVIASQASVIAGVLTGGKLIPLLPGTHPFGQGPGAVAF